MFKGIEEIEGVSTVAGLGTWPTTVNMRKEWQQESREGDCAKIDRML